MRFDVSDVVDRNVFLQHNGTEFGNVPLDSSIDAVKHLVFGHADARTQHGRRLLNRMGTILSNQNDVVRGAIVSKDTMLTVVDAAAWRQQRYFAYAILVCSLLVIGDLDDLHVPEAEDEDQQRRNNNVSDN